MITLDQIAPELAQAIREAKNEPVGEAFRGEDGLVHIVYARFDTLCDLTVAVEPRDIAVDLVGEYLGRGAVITCIKCIAAR